MSFDKSKPLNQLNQIYCTNYVQNLFKKIPEYSKFWVEGWCNGVQNVPICPYVWQKLINLNPNYIDLTLLLRRLYQLYHLLIVVEGTSEWQCMYYVCKLNFVIYTQYIYILRSLSAYFTIS